MNASNTSPRSVVFVALDAPRAAVLTVLAQRYPHARVQLDDADAIHEESLAANEVARNLLRKAKDMGGRLHLIGLVSDGGVHSSLGHVFALIDMAKNARVRVVVHALLDGVDVPPHSARRYIAELEAKLDGGVGRIGTVSGRYWGMDCEGHWDRVQKVYQAMLADGVRRVDSAIRGIGEACSLGTSEGRVEPFVVFDYPGVSLVDTALHFNFGAVRARQLSHALAGASFSRFARKGGRAPFAGRFACMTPCDGSLALPTLFPRAPDPLNLPVEALASAGYPHSYFAQGDARAIAKASDEAIRSGRYRFVLSDFADPENPGFGGSAEALDVAVDQVIEAARATGAAVILTGGRGAENSFPLVYVHDGDADARLRDDGRVEDLGPTLLELVGLPRLADTEGVSLLVR